MADTDLRKHCDRRQIHGCALCDERMAPVYVYVQRIFGIHACFSRYSAGGRRTDEPGASAESTQYRYPRWHSCLCSHFTPDTAILLRVIILSVHFHTHSALPPVLFTLIPHPPVHPDLYHRESSSCIPHPRPPGFCAGSVSHGLHCR